MSYAKVILTMSVIVHGQDHSDLQVNLRQVFERYRQYRIAFNPRKAKLDSTELIG